MKYLLNIIFIFTIQYSFGQSYLNYYTQVNEAKLLAADSNYLESALLYKKTFEEYDFEFARDCINAMEVSSLNSIDSLTSYFIKSALKRGVPISYFSKNANLSDFRLTPYWNSITKDSATFRSEYESNIKTEIRDEINQMFSADQQIRERYYQWSNFLLRPSIGKKWKKLNSEQVMRIMEITKNHGFPGERLIGIDSPEYHEKINSNQFSAGMPIILFVHHYSQPNFSYDSLLFAEVFKGNLYNEHFATICDFEAEFGKSKFACYGYYGLRHKPKNYKPDEFIEKRKEIGLLSNSEIQKLNRSNGMTKFWNSLK